jgi:hypothetical protein
MDRHDRHLTRAPWPSRKATSCIDSRFLPASLFCALRPMPPASPNHRRFPCVPETSVSTSRVLDIWNQILGNVPVKKFTNRQTAIRRIWNWIETRSAASPPVAQKARRPKSQFHPPAHATKSETVLALLRQPGGATHKALMTATGWQAHSVRDFISGQLTKRLRLKIQSVKRDGERVYSIRS